jgi:hypothetical protein
MDSAVFLCPLWRNQQKEPFSLQRVSGGELQTTDCELTFARHQQVFGIHQARKTKSEVCESSTKELFGECNQ